MVEQIQLLRQTAYEVLSPRFQLSPEDREEFERLAGEHDSSVDFDLARIVSTQVDNIVDVVGLWLSRLGQQIFEARIAEIAGQDEDI
jgi:hypothetical protein